MSERNASPRRVATAIRRDQALKLRASGATLAVIADQLGYKTRAAASQDISRALALLRTESAQEMKAISNDRLDMLFRHTMQILLTKHLVVSNGTLVMHQGKPLKDDDPALRAIGKLLDIEARRARLNGLDAPKQVEVITIDLIEAEIKRLNAELGRAEADQASAAETTAG